MTLRTYQRKTVDNMDYFVVGSGQIPEWMIERVLTFRTADGGIGYELQGSYGDFILNEGDVVIRNEKGNVTVKKCRTKKIPED